MLSISIQISKQEIKDFPLEHLQIDSKWQDFIDPKYDYRFQKPRNSKRRVA